MNNFGQIASNVGTRVGDTSSSFSTTIKGYINQRYERIYKRFNWPTINPTYSFVTDGSQDFALPTDFKNELYVFDATNLVDVDSSSLQELERFFSSMINDTGAPVNYAIYDYMSTDDIPVISKKIRLFPTAPSGLTIKIPYQMKPVALVESDELPILQCDIACEYGATADAWRTKRQFAKAGDFEAMYEQVINEMIWEIENNPNRIVQFAPKTYNQELLY